MHSAIRDFLEERQWVFFSQNTIYKAAGACFVENGTGLRICTLEH